MKLFKFLKINYNLVLGKIKKKYMKDILKTIFLERELIFYKQMKFKYLLLNLEKFTI